MPNASQTIIHYAIEKIATEPLRRRAELYRALAELVPTNADRKKLIALALECEAIDAAHEQLAFAFRVQKRSGGNGQAGKN